ncbi:MAG: hypothetical protein AAGI07_07600, partial [Bacteroidota bacterium]
FKKFEHKIIHIIIDKFPSFFVKFRKPTPWDLDNHQKEGILKGLTNCHPDDQIIVSDVDEIPRAELVSLYKNSSDTKVFEQRFYNYYLNCICIGFEGINPLSGGQVNKNGLGYWRGSVMLPYNNIKSIKKARLNRDKRKDVITIEDGGWHFSHMGGAKKVWEKLNAYAHPECRKDFYNIEKIEEAMLKGIGISTIKVHLEIVNTTDKLPSYVLANENRFRHLFYKDRKVVDG